MAYTYSRRNIFLAKLLEAIAHLFYWVFNLHKSEPEVSNQPNKILIIEPFHMGDVISLSVMIEPLKEKYPASKILILTKKKNEAVFEYDQRINVITSEFPWSDYKKKWDVIGYLRLFIDIIKTRRIKIELGLDPRGDIRSQLVLLMIGCKQRIGYTNYLNSNMNFKGSLLTIKADRPCSEHRYDWNRHLLTFLGIENSKPIKFPSIDLSSFKMNGKKRENKSILIHPGSGWFYKQWPLDNWVGLIEKLTKQEQINITVIGAKEEQKIITQIEKALTENKVVFKITTIKDLINCILLCDVFICLDSGPMNLAVCLDKPVVALFGPGDSDVWKPYSSKGFFIHNKENYPCNPCFQKNCYYPGNNCMSVISVEEVISYVNKFLS